jgi:lysophospholipase L1-like esterase
MDSLGLSFRHVACKRNLRSDRSGLCKVIDSSFAERIFKTTECTRNELATMALQPNRRLLAVGAMGLVSICLALAYIRYYIERPVGSGPAGPAVPREPFQSTWSERQVLLLGIGDSVTAGLGAKHPSHSYFQRLAYNPADEHADLKGVCLSRVLPNLTMRNLAISGSTSLTHAEVVHERLEHQAPEVFGIVVMTTGGNDLIHNYGRTAAREGAMFTATMEQARPWIERFEQRLGGMLDAIIAKFPGGCEIYLADIYDPTDGVGDGASIMLPAWPDGLAIHAEYNRAIQRAVNAREPVHGVSLYTTFLGHGGHCRQFWRPFYDARDPHYWFYENVEDPNDRGYDAIRRIFMTAIVNNSRLNPTRTTLK